jgi:hypothetical protein
MGGIRPIKFRRIESVIPAAIVLVTHHASRGSSANPWEDLVDLQHGRIVYWGDAKFHADKSVDDWVGNRALRVAFGLVLDNVRHFVPPILHFSKTSSGYTRFNGLCVLDRLELTWFEDAGRPVRNYRAHLSVLDQEFVDATWIHDRAAVDSLDNLRASGPDAWRHYLAGRVDRLRVWAPSVRTQFEQLPLAGSPEERILGELTSMTPTGFEAAVVALFRQLDGVQHNIERTRPTGDGGFDFFGTFTLPPPLEYEIEFLGEAKRYGLRTAVTPKDVSRLVARLGRGQYGIFATTSYFTSQAQEEVLADSYPAKLVAGADLVRIMRELRVASAGAISPIWLADVQQELATMTVPYSVGSRTGHVWANEPRSGYGSEGEG